MPTIPQEIADSTQRLLDSTDIVQQFAQGTANLQIATDAGTLRPLTYWQNWFQSELTVLAQPYVDQIDASTQTATDAANAASASATDAAGSASAAGTSASNAATSEGNAAASASDSASSAAAAANSETAASSSAAAAATSESNAATSASAAQTAQTGAETAESNAAGSASAAATSETNASGSATTASNQAAAAAGSASAAATSASNADSARQAAASSANAAATSETNAASSANAAATSEGLSQQYANEAEDVEVQPGEYSAYHWSQKAKSAAQMDVYWADILSKPTNFAYQNSNVTFVQMTSQKGKLTFNLDHQDFFVTKRHPDSTNTTPWTWRVENNDWRLWMYGSDSIGRTALQANVETGVVNFPQGGTISGNTIATEAYVDTQVGDIGTILDNINGV